MSGELTNTSLGRFHVRELLGRDLTIKVLPAELSRDPVRVERFASGVLNRDVFAIRGFR